MNRLNLYLNHGCLGYHENLKVVELSWQSLISSPRWRIYPQKFVFIYVFSFSRGRMAPTVTLKLLLVHIVDDFLRILPTMGFITINLTIWASHFCEETQIQELLQDFWNFHPETWEKVFTWNAKCPIFKGNFTPKTSNYCLKNRVLGFQVIWFAHIFFRVAQPPTRLRLGLWMPLLWAIEWRSRHRHGFGRLKDLDPGGIWNHQFFDVGWWQRVAPHFFIV